MRYILSTFFILLAVHSEVAFYSTDDFTIVEELAAQLPPNSLVLFDVDDTLITPVDIILKRIYDDFFQSLYNHIPEGPDIWREVRLHAPHVPVDQRSVTLVKQLQQRGIVTLAYTAADPKLPLYEAPCDWRIEELFKYGYDFSQTFPLPNGSCLIFSKHTSNQRTPMYKSGVLFSAFQLKGDILQVFLKEIGWIPDQILFVDDSSEQVRSVVKAMKSMGISGAGIHYHAAHRNVPPLNEERGRQQVAHFLQHNVWIPDSDLN